MKWVEWISEWEEEVELRKFCLEQFELTTIIRNEGTYILKWKLQFSKAFESQVQFVILDLSFALFFSSSCTKQLLAFVVEFVLLQFFLDFLHFPPLCNHHTELACIHIEREHGKIASNWKLELNTKDQKSKVKGREILLELFIDFPCYTKEFSFC